MSEGPVTSQPRSQQIQIDVPQIDFNHLMQGNWRKGCLECLDDPPMCKFFKILNFAFLSQFKKRFATFAKFNNGVGNTAFFRSFWILLSMPVGLEKCWSFRWKSTLTLCWNFFLSYCDFTTLQNKTKVWNWCKYKHFFLEKNVRICYCLEHVIDPQILREINFGESKTYAHKNQNSEPLNMLEWQMLRDWQTLISREIWFTEKSWNFHTVHK